MKSTFLFVILWGLLPNLQAQQALPVVVINRVYISDPDLSRNQSFYYRRKEEFHQVLVYDLGEHSGKKAPVDFYVDFLAVRENVKPLYIITVKWKQLQFYNGQTELRSVQGVNSRTQRIENGVTITVPQIQNEYRYNYLVMGLIEIQIQRVKKEGNQLLLNKTEPVKYEYSTQFKATQRMGQWVKPPAAPNPDKPAVFKELLAVYYDDIKKTFTDYFNSPEFNVVVKGN